MIEFNREGKTVKCSVTIAVPTHNATWNYHFYWAAVTETYAGFLVDAMRTQVGEKLEAIRKDAYEQGWKDAKAKRAKNTWWPGTWGFRWGGR